MARERPSVETLHKLLRLEDGVLYWLPREPINAHTRAWNTRHAGKRADNPRHGRYTRVVIFDQHHYAHHVIWAMTVGEWPAGEIDHRDGDPGNNRTENLREATRTQQMQNKRVSKRNKSGLKGVSWNRANECWEARVSTSASNLYRGRFNTAEEAHQAYAREAAKIYGEFACSDR